ncbi:MAG: redoxin domain-containing protein, partial [Bacteroidales bacterium]|nr:redoxin domain-containing protein [Bacteroidales bacterium]
MSRTVAIYLGIILLIYSPLGLPAAERADCKPDSNIFQQEVKTTSQKLYQAIDNYLLSVPAHIDSMIKACDYLIGQSNDSTTKSMIAGYLFNHFSSSGFMGFENVAVYIAKNYFLNERLKWNGEGGVTLLRLYTEFNENSLLGMSAPELQLSGADLRPLSLRELPERYTIIYFFDDECQLCKEKFPELKQTVDQYRYLNLAVYAVFTRSDSDKLSKFISDNFGSAVGAVESGWRFVHDPGSMSDFHKLYNVLKTPQMFLIDSDKKIIGRDLDNKALKTLLDAEAEKIAYYFSQAEAFVPKYLEIFNLGDSADLKDAFTPLFERLTKESREIYNAVFYNVFEHLWVQDDQKTKDAAIYAAKNFILPYPSLWYDKKFINERVPAVIARIESNRVGADAPSIKLYNSKGRLVNLTGRRSPHTLLYFFNTGCAICKPFTFELKQIYPQLKKK